MKFKEIYGNIDDLYYLATMVDFSMASKRLEDIKRELRKIEKQFKELLK